MGSTTEVQSTHTVIETQCSISESTCFFEASGRQVLGHDAQSKSQEATDLDSDTTEFSSLEVTEKSLILDFTQKYTHVRIHNSQSSCSFSRN